MEMPKFVSPIAGEVMVAETHPSRWNYFGSIVMGILFIPLLVGVVILWWIHICIKSSCYVATNMRVIAKTGWLNTKQVEVRIADIRSVNLERTFRQRLFGTGDIAINTAATAGSEIVMLGVTDPEQFVNMINAQRKIEST